MPKSDEHEARDGAQETYGQDDADMVAGDAGSCLIGFELRGGLFFFRDAHEFPPLCQTNDGDIQDTDGADGGGVQGSGYLRLLLHRNNVA